MEWELYFVQGIEMLFLGVGSYFDIKNRELPIWFLLLSGMVAVLCNVIWKYQSKENVLVGAGIGLLFLAIGWITKEAIGYGDGIGILILGICEGWKGMLPVIFAAFLLGGIYGLWKLIGLKESANNTMPFFPFLWISMMGVIFL